MRLAYLLILALCVALPGPAAQSSSKGSKAKQALTTLTGVVDEKGDEFILSDEKAMKTTAILRAQGFTDDNFARFVGNRVEVRGELKTEGDRRILIVKSLDDLKSLGPSGK